MAGVSRKGMAPREKKSGKSLRSITNGTDISFGNNVSHAKNRTRRSFKLNMFQKDLYSSVLDKMVRVNVTNQGLRVIDKYGGLDNYLVKGKECIGLEGKVAGIRKEVIIKVKNREARVASGIANIKIKVNEGGGEEGVKVVA